MKPPDHCVAVIGMACRLPGCDGLEELWKTLVNGENHIREIPEEDRWNIDAFYDENPDIPGKMYVKKAGLLDSIYEWDNVLFDVNDYEATHMDPQQRLALEVTYRAVENAGLTEPRIKGTNTAVYMGLMNDDFSKVMGLDPDYPNNYTATGTGLSLLSNRISYTFDIHGPSVTMDTACSSSLVAVHHGVQSILMNESNMAICGGVNLIIAPGPTVALCKAGMASKEGQCHAFSSKADGYVRSEGCAVVILKDAKKAIEDGDVIWGYISTQCNSDGKTETPIHKPSKQMQKSLIMSTMNNLDLDLNIVQYVEMHGTGTPVGDPIETGAVGETIGKARKVTNQIPLKIGSVKSNIGHTEAAAGTTGLIKTLLMMNKQTFVPSLFSDFPSSDINFSNLHLSVVNKVEPWGEIDSTGVRIASLNCFGFGGTNVHGVIQQYSIHEFKNYSPKMPKLLICFSGKSENSVKYSIQHTIDAIESGDINESNMYELEYTSTNMRNHFHYRKAIAVSKDNSVTTVKNALMNVMKEKSGIVKLKKTKLNPNTIFVFNGMGSHWKGMGLEYYKTFPVFREIIDQIDHYLSMMTDFKLVECFIGDRDIDNPFYGQVAIFGVQVGLVHIIKEYYGLLPNAIVGHSMGEVAAAYASNALSLTSAVRVIYERSKLLAGIQGGNMLAVGNISIQNLEKYLVSEELEIAAYNSSKSFTVSGSPEEIEKLKTRLESEHKNIFVRKLKVNAAYHSHYVDPVLPELRERLKKLQCSENAAKICQVSTACIKLSPNHLNDHHTQFKEADYWVNNARNPVMFELALKKVLLSDRKNIVIEIGAKPVLRKNIEDIAYGTEYRYFTPMTSFGGSDALFVTLTRLYEEGLTIKFKPTSNRMTWPKYGFDTKRLKDFPPKAISFLEAKTSSSVRSVHMSSIINGYKCNVSLISRYKTPFVFDHIVGNDVVAPGALYVELAASTALLHYPNLFMKYYGLAVKVYFKKACIIEEGNSATMELKTTLFDTSENVVEFDVTTPNKLYATGEMFILKDNYKEGKQYNITMIESRCPYYFREDDLYNKLKVYGFNHGPMLRCVQSGRRNDSEILARISVTDKQYDNYVIHPSLLDCLLQLVVLFPTSDSFDSGTQILPLGIDEVVIKKVPPSEAFAYICLKDVLEGMFTVDAVILDREGKPFVYCNGLKIGAMNMASNINFRDTLFQLSWRTFTDTHQSKALKCMLISNYEPQTIIKMKSAGLVAIDALDIDTVFSKDSELQVQYLPEMDSITDVIYAFDSRTPVNQLNDTDMSDVTAHLCQRLVNLIVYMQQHHSDVTVSLLTNQVELLLNKQISDNTLNGMIGYALWGMMRTVMVEYPLQKYYLMDVLDFTEETLSTLYLLLSSKPTASEFNIGKGEIRYSCFTTMPSMTIPRSYRYNSYNHNVKSSAEKRIVHDTKKSTYLSSPGKGNRCRNQEDIQIDSAYILSSMANLDFYTRTAEKDKKQLLSIGSKGNIGYIGVHIIQLLGVSNHATISKDYLVPIDKFPSEIPTATLWFTAWLLTEFLQNELLYISSSESTEIWTNTIRQVCALRKLKECDKICEADIVCLVVHSVEHVRVLLEDISFSKVQNVYVLTWNKQVKYDILRYLCSKYANHRVISLEDVLTNLEELKTLVGSFSDWLDQCDKDNLQRGINAINKTFLKDSTNDCDVNTAHIRASQSNFMTDQIMCLKSNQANCQSVKVTSTNIYRKDGGYIVFGGSKGLGWQIVLEMIDKGIGKVGIVSRSGLSQDKVELCKKLESQYCCTILDLKGDVTKVDDIIKVKNVFNLHNPEIQLNGIFVGTAVVNDGMITTMTVQKFKDALGPKISGILNIGKTFKNEQLDFFIAHSSLSAMMGNAGQANYSAGNAFVDAFMCHYRSKYGVGQTICWGPLDMGLLDNQRTRLAMKKLGLGVMNKTEIMQCLTHNIHYNPPMVSYAKFHWEVFMKRLNKVENFALYFEELFQRKGHYITWFTAGEGDPQTILDISTESGLEYLHGILRDVVMIEEDDIDDDIPMESLGVDSMYAQTIYSVLMKRFKQLHGLSSIALNGMSIRQLHTVLTENK